MASNLATPLSVEASSLLLSESERLNRLRLIRSENVGPVTYHQLLSRYGSGAEALKHLPDLAKRGGRKASLRVCPLEKAEREWSLCQKFGAHLLVHGDPDYPALLKGLSDAPPVLTVKGNRDLLSRKTLGMVGARNASLNGKLFARKVSMELGKKGYVLGSGLARGIDTSVHEGALETGTLAVLAGGIDHIYPPENKALYHEISEKGLLVAESPFGIIPQATSFPRRNRLISGLSLGVVVVEATLKSGSLITARCALDQGRDVFAVPGSPLDPRSRGTNQLIREGAPLVQSSTEILEALDRPLFMREVSASQPDMLFEKTSENIEQELDAARQEITNYLSPTPISVDEILRQCHFSRMVVILCLIELELAGKMTRHPGNLVSLVLDGCLE